MGGGLRDWWGTTPESVENFSEGSFVKSLTRNPLSLPVGEILMQVWSVSSVKKVSI